MRHGRFVSLVVLAVLAAALAPSLLSAGDKITLGKQFPAAKRVSFDQIDHAAWNKLLERYCDPQGMVDYTGWKASSPDRQSLEKYLASLSQADVAKPAAREAKLAFWINAYNAVTVEGILREYPTSSIRNHTAKVFGYNIWDDLLLTVGSQSYSLNQMEHEVLRKMGDPRIHFAIVCASVGCPPLRDEAYVADRIDEQLTDNAKRFFGNPAKFQAEPRSRKISVSPILKWFADDFGADQAAQMRTIAPFLPDKASQQLARSGQASVEYLDYDWSLNDQAKHPSTARRSGR
ncbi:MAG TPA: DUF547 domain-containing protein [Pirellulales bacterium]|nr:DUF547 domain-containing protein [Pirellulales bacterium]